MRRAGKTGRMGAGAVATVLVLLVFALSAAVPGSPLAQALPASGIASAATASATGDDRESDAPGTDAGGSGASYEDADAVANAKELIKALPADPDKVGEAERGAVEAAQAAYDVLSEADRKALDSEVLDKEQSYGRWLESAQWGLAAATEKVDDTTTLADGDYSAYIKSSSDMGKSNSERAKSWTAVELHAKAGKLTALIRCDSTSAFKKMRLGGVEYTAKVVKDVPEFTVPIQVNTNFKFTVDASDIADSIPYEMEVQIDLAKATSEQVAKARSAVTKALQGIKETWTAASVKRVRTAAQALSRVAAKEGVAGVELAAAQAALSDSQKAAKEKPRAKAAGKKSSGGSTRGSSRSAGNAGGAGVSGGSSRAGTTAAGAGSVTGTASQAGSGASSSSESGKPAESGDKSKVEDEGNAKAVEVAPGEAGVATADGAGSGESAATSDEPNYGLLLGLGLLLLLVLGMVARTVVFGRMMGLSGKRKAEGTGEGGEGKS